MRKLFTALCLAVVAFLASVTAWAEDTMSSSLVYSYEKTDEKLTPDQLESGMYVAIQGVHNNSANTRGFLGSNGFSYASFIANGETVYQIEKMSDGKVKLKNIGSNSSSNKFLKKPGNQIEHTFNASEAAILNVRKADGSDGKQNYTTPNHSDHSNLVSGTEYNKLNRFYTSNGKILNALRNWAAGDGGFTVFYIWKVIEHKASTYTYKYTVNGRSLLTEQHTTRLGQPFATPRLPLGGVVETSTVPSEVVAEGHNNQTYEVKLVPPFGMHAQYDAASQYFYTFGLRESNKFVSWDAIANYFRVQISTSGVKPQDEQLFQFVGTDIGHVKIVNRKSGQALGGERRDHTNLLLVDRENQNAGVFELGIGEQAGVLGFVLRETSNENLYFHNLGNLQPDSRLAYWMSSSAKNDKGSFVFFNKVNTQDYQALLNVEKEIVKDAFEAAKTAYPNLAIALTKSIESIGALNASSKEELETARQTIKTLEMKFEAAKNYAVKYNKLTEVKGRIGVHTAMLGQLNQVQYEAAEAKHNEIVAAEEMGFATEKEYAKALKTIDGVKLNTPREGMLLQIQPNFHKEVTDSRLIALFQPSRVWIKKTSATGLNAVFYYTDGHLLNLGTGTGFKVADDTIRTGYYENGDRVEFGTTPDYMYSIKVGDFYLKADANDGVNQGGMTNTTAVNDNLGWNQFLLHSVASLPLYVGETGYATFCSPVPVTVADGFEAYRAESKNGETLNLELLTGVIPAHTAFIVKAKQTTQLPSVCQLMVAQASTNNMDNNLLKGKVIYDTSLNGGNFYGLTTHSSNPKKAVFGLLTNISPIPFRAFYVEESSTASVRELKFGFKGTLTGVEAVGVDQQQAPLYDLSGRRVKQAVKGGVYLQAGQKIVVQ